MVGPAAWLIFFTTAQDTRHELMPEAPRVSSLRLI
jgi:hypothetical protein